MDTAMFLMGVFGIMGLLMSLGMSSSHNRAKLNGERNTEENSYDSGAYFLPFVAYYRCYYNFYKAL